MYTSNARRPYHDWTFLEDSRTTGHLTHQSLDPSVKTNENSNSTLKLTIFDLSNLKPVKISTEQTMMSISKSLTLATLLATTGNLFVSGMPLDFNPAIVGGDIIEENQYPYYVQIEAAGSLCGGTLIAPDMVLYAAHCGNGTNGEFKVNAYNRHDLSGNATLRRCTDYRAHPNYVSPDDAQPDFSDFLDWDFSLCKLNQPVFVNENQARLELNWDHSVPTVGDEVVAIGMGRIWWQGELPDNTRHVQIPVYDCSIHVFTLPELRVCAAEPGQGICSGDSGGPLVRIDGNVHTLIGVSSATIDCESGNWPGGIFARTSVGLDWIQETTCLLGSIASFCSSEAPSQVASPVPSEAPSKVPSQSPPVISSTSPTIHASESPTAVSSESPTETTSNSPSNKPTEPPSPAPLPCRNRCNRSSTPWSTKCTWRGCLGCDACRELTQAPTASPTVSPTGTPTSTPTNVPTNSPSTATPTGSPTGAPTNSPTGTPTATPTGSPTGSPTSSPTGTPTASPTGAPTNSPTNAPSTATPTGSPTGAPSNSPTATSTANPTKSPTASPTNGFDPVTDPPTATPTANPTEAPCRDRCLRNRRPWSTKCTWRNCSGCPACL